ncbi:MAG TPA: FMN-binding negative transcriptional regulator [Roseiflexaceae bacterium]|nr:FMN-binding negative transcriptional regulator [Roseiflexaceae bacterium]
MYIPNAFREEDAEQLVAFMRAHSFITLVSVLEGAPFASHIPVALAVRDGQVVLSGHVARANPHWRAFGAGESLAIFGGPHAYVSPALYERRESVPTWNYIAVHAYGVPRPVSFAESPAAVERALAELIATYDAAYQAHWESLPQKFRDGMMQGVVAFEMAVTRLEGKYKLSQNRSEADQRRVAEALLQRAAQAARETGTAMAARLAAQPREEHG